MNVMKETKTLDGVLLDLVVASLEGKDLENLNDYHPSTNWADGGPIIEREKINIQYDGIGLAKIYECSDGFGGNKIVAKATGDTMLQAAMRCYVMAKIGRVVDLVVIAAKGKDGLVE